MKKLLAGLLAGVMVLGVTGCEKSPSPDESGTEGTISSSIISGR